MTCELTPTDFTLQRIDTVCGCGHASLVHGVEGCVLCALTEPSDGSMELFTAATAAIEAVGNRVDLMHAHVENLIERMHDLETWLARTNPGYARHVNFSDCTCGWGGPHDPATHAAPATNEE